MQDGGIVPTSNKLERISYLLTPEEWVRGERIVKMIELDTEATCLNCGKKTIIVLCYQNDLEPFTTCEPCYNCGQEYDIIPNEITFKLIKVKD